MTAIYVLGLRNIRYGRGTVLGGFFSFHPVSFFFLHSLYLGKLLETIYVNQIYYVVQHNHAVEI